MSNQLMLKQLRTSLKQLEKAKKIQDKILNDQIAQLPEDKRKQANDLLNKARKGNIDLGEMMAFTSDIRGVDKEEIKEAVNRANDKKKEVTGK